MAGYAKIWTDIKSDAWFISLPCIARGIFMQLIIDAKMQGDCGIITGRSWSHLGSGWGADARIARKYVEEMQAQHKLTITASQKCVSIYLHNYQYWQGLTKNEVNPNKRPSKQKCSKIPVQPDQTRPDQTNIVEPKNSGPTPAQKISKKEPNPDHKTFVDFFCQEYEKPERFGTKYLFNGGKDGEIVKKLLATFPLEKLKAMAIRYFETDDEFIKGNMGHTIGGFKIKAQQIAESLAPKPEHELTPSQIRAREILEEKNARRADKDI